MATPQTIAIIGATGSMGAALARQLSAGNYRLLLFASHVEDVERLAQNLKHDHPAAEVDSSLCPFDASWEADIIILAVHPDVEKQVAEKIRQVATQKIVISMSNPEAAEPGTSAAEALQQLLPNAKIFKSFNTLLAADFNTPTIAGTQADVLIAGNDTDAAQTVASLVKAAGFNPVFAGKLEASRTLENMGRLLAGLNDRYDLGGVAAWKLLHHHNRSIQQI